MDNLSSEILHIILQYLYDSIRSTDDPKAGFRWIASLATVSRHWRAVVEYYTFRHRRVSSSHLTTFSDHFVHPHRRGLLRDLVYLAVLPSYGDPKCFKLESDRDKRRNNQAFQSATVDLFQVLKAWTTSQYANTRSAQGTFSLLLHAYSPSDDVYRFAGAGSGIGEARYKYSLLSFSDDDLELPSLPFVTDFWTLGGARQLDPLSLSVVFNALPALTRLELWMVKPFMKQPSLQRKHRNDLGRSLSALQSRGTLKHLRLWYEYGAPFNHSFQICDFREPGDSMDLLSSALRELAATSLVELDLQGGFILSNRFFDGFESKTIHRLMIKAAITTAEGAWWYTGDPADVDYDPDELFTGSSPPSTSSSDSDSAPDAPSSDDEDASTDSGSLYYVNERRENLLTGAAPSHAWRTRIDSSMFSQFIADVAKTAPKLPSLKTFNFEIGWELPGSCHAGVELLNRGKATPEKHRGDMEQDEANTAVRRFLVLLGRDVDWEASDEVADMMQLWAGFDGIARVGKW